jgi:uncharacterized membrane protein (DUF485 family)
VNVLSLLNHHVLFTCVIAYNVNTITGPLLSRHCTYGFVMFTVHTPTSFVVDLSSSA